MPMPDDQETTQHCHRFEVAGGPHIFYAECACGRKLTRYWLDARDPARTRHRPHSLDGRSVDAMFGTFYRGRPDFAARRRALRR
jgi:hypothetical protein